MGGSTAGSPHYEPLERLARGTGVSTERLDQLLALYRAICAEAGAERPTGAAALDSWGSDRQEDLEEIAAEMADSLKPEIYQALMAFESVLVADEPPLTPQEARDLAADQWRRLLPLSHPVRLFAFTFKDFRNWALCELLCEESLQATADDPGAARELAEEALMIAEKVRDGATPRPRLIAYTLAHLAKADSACGDPEEADEKMQRARQIWQAGDGSDGLDDARFAALVGAGS